MVVNLTGLQGLHILVCAHGHNYLVRCHRLSCWHRTHNQQASSPVSQADQYCSRSACTWARLPTDVGDLICLLVRTIHHQDRFPLHVCFHLFFSNRSRTHKASPLIVRTDSENLMLHLRDLRTVPIIYLGGPTTSPIIRNAHTIPQDPRTGSFMPGPTHPRRPSLHM
jgi:hypothetical protein